MVRLGYKCMDDWYNVTVNEIYDHGGEGLLRNYYSSFPSEALQKVYPKHNWKLWRFKIVPRGYWTKLENQRGFLEWLQSQKLAVISSIPVYQ